MNPYYVVFFSTAIGDRLKKVGKIYKKAGCIKENIERLKGRDLGIAIAKGMIRLSEDIGFPVKLQDVAGYSPDHRIKCLEAAKDPKLASKLKNMPVQLGICNSLIPHTGHFFTFSRICNSPYTTVNTLRFY